MADGTRREDEMRPITALFADIVGSTALGERLGPDEVKALVGECVTRMSRAVEEFGGVVQAFMGDGICAYFGVPTAHEDDPERAARAGLRIIGVATEYGAEVEATWGITGFNVRVGINSGQAAVGLVGGEDTQTVALGDTTNVAARLQSAAEPGTISIGEGTAGRLAEGYVLEPLGELAVKGRAQAVTTWRLVGPRPATEPRPATPLVGRDGELGRLADSIRDLTSGRGHALLVVGEAGIGKSRMLSELRSRLGEDVTWLQARCISYGTGVPYQPFVDILRTWLGVDEGDAELALRTKLRARIGALFGAVQQDVLLPYLGLMLSIRLDPSTERDLLSLTADELADRMRGAYVAWVEAVAAQRPLALAIDDLQWADPTTRMLAELLLGVTDRAAVLIVVAMRPDPASEGWALRLHAQTEFAHRVVELPLPALTPEAARQLIDAIVPPGMLGDALKDEIVTRAEGNPLYVEELLRALLEAGGTDRRRTWTISPGSTSSLPPALESLLVARIDRLPPAPRRLAQVAAVVGREFPVAIATAAAESADPDRDLGALLRADVVREIRRFPELECVFRHGLVQEAALSTLTPSAMRELYGRVGAIVEERHADALDEYAERLAFYFYRSDERAKALGYLELAGNRASGVEAFGRAEELWDRAGKLAAKLGDTEAERRIATHLEALRARATGEHARPI